MLNVLVVDDEPQIVQSLLITLRAHGYAPYPASSGTTALDEATRRPPELVLLDLGLPDMDGSAVIRALRAWTAVPIIVLSGRTGGSEKVAALDAGADDYVTKPFGMDELMARIRAVLRRAEGVAATKPTEVSIGRHRIDLNAHLVRRDDGAEVHLTKTEWQLLERLVDQPGKLITQRQLLTEIWGPAYAEESGYLRFHFGQLRRKLEVDPARPQRLITEPGLGYRFVE